MTDDRAVDGEVFDPALLANGRATARVEVTERDLRARVGDQLFVLPLAGLRAEITGIDQGALRLSHPSHERTVIVLRDLSLARGGPLSRVPTVEAALAEGRSQSRRVWGCGCAALLAVAVLVAAVLLLSGPAIDWAVGRLPIGLEQDIGDLLLPAVHDGQVLVSDSRTLDALERLSAPLVEVSETPISLYVVRDDALNAYALPGGHITFHSGLLEAATRPEQVLGVLAHEMAHVSGRHALRSLAGRLGLLAGAQMVFGDASALVALAADVGVGLAELEFSRDLEEEADRVALRSLAAADVDPRGLLELLELLLAREGDGLVPAFLLTHPPTEQRLATLEEALDDLDYRARPRPAEDLQRLQEALASNRPPP